MRLWGKKDVSAGFACIGMHADGVSFVAAKQGPGQPPEVTAWEFRGCAEGAERESVLTALADDYKLDRQHCITLLDPGDYRLLVAEAPPLPDEEMAEAMRWRVKDVVDFDINDAVVDVFAFPETQDAQGSKPVYVVVARNQALQRRIQIMEKARINLEVVDIPELALRNVASLLPSAERGVALLSLEEQTGIITLTKQDVLYMSRTLNVGLDDMRKAKERAFYLDRIVLEIQRSLDYYVSHFHQAPIDRLVMAPLPEGFLGLELFFAERLGIKVDLLHLSELARWDKSLPMNVEPRCVATFGAALRRMN